MNQFLDGMQRHELENVIREARGMLEDYDDTEKESLWLVSQSGMNVAGYIQSDYQSALLFIYEHIKFLVYSFEIRPLHVSLNLVEVQKKRVPEYLALQGA
jgi:hypothetical protein